MKITEKLHFNYCGTFNTSAKQMQTNVFQVQLHPKSKFYSKMMPTIYMFKTNLVIPLFFYTRLLNIAPDV